MVKKFAIEHELEIFLLLTIPLAWVFWIQMVLNLWPAEFILIPSTLGALSPLFSLSILERITDGETSVDKILSTAKTWRTSLPWLLAAVFAFPLLSVLANGINYVSGYDSSLSFVIPSIIDELGIILLAVIPIHYAASLITSPLFEEPGWRGFALVQLQSRYGREIGSFVIGTYWWLWHQMMNIAFGIWPSVLGYLSMLAQSFMIDSLFNLSNRNILAAMFTHQALGTAFVFLYNSSKNFTLTILVWIFVLALRIVEKEKLQAVSSNGQS